MGNRSGSLMAMVALVAISVAMPVAQAPVAAQQQYGRIAKYNAACTEVTNIRKKEHLTALPANVIEPKRTPEGWPDLQGAWNSNAYRVSGIHSIELGLDPAGFGIQCQDAASSMGNLLVDPMRGMIPYQPAALAKKMEYLAATYAPAKRMDTDTDVRCFVRGVPHDVTNGAFRIRYIPGYTENREDSCHEGERAVDTMVRAGLRARAVGIKGYHIHVDLDTGKAIRPEEQKYLDQSGQPLGLSYAPRVPDEVLPQK